MDCRPSPATPYGVGAAEDYRCIEHLLLSIIGHARILSLESDHMPDEMSRQVAAISDAARRVSILFHRSCMGGSIPRDEKPAKDLLPFYTLQKNAGASP
jgi:hypothetical protein